MAERDQDGPGDVPQPLQDLDQDGLRLAPLGFVRAGGGGVQRLVEDVDLLGQDRDRELGGSCSCVMPPWMSSRASLR